MTDKIPWKPDYTHEFGRRALRLSALRQDPVLLAGAKEYYSTRPAEYIQDWGITFDPRNAGRDLPTTMPFILFPRQKEFIDFIEECVAKESSGLVGKSRDMGLSWLCCAYAVWTWTFKTGATVGFGSRKESAVDQIGVIDSIFEKMRMLIKYTPDVFKPKGFDISKHAPFMRILNPENGSSIIGEAGDNVGRGSRTLVYFLDEAAFVERPQLIESALNDTTRVRIDVSTPNGVGNVFHSKYESGTEWVPGGVIRNRTNVFSMSWRDHPNKSQAWYDDRRAKAEAEGLLAQFKQEIDIDFMSAKDNLVIAGDWVMAAVDAVKKLKLQVEGKVTAGLDVADGGKDLNALCVRQGINISHIEAWGSPDTNITAQMAVNTCKRLKVEHLNWDSVGVGAGVKAALNQIEKMPFSHCGWNGGEKPYESEERIIKGDRSSPTNREFFSNLKAQGYWRLRLRFLVTHRAVTTGVMPSDPSLLISIPGDLPNLRQVIKELCQATYSTNGKGQIVIDKAPDGSKSPNLCDAMVMAFTVKTVPMFFSSSF